MANTPHARPRTRGRPFKSDGERMEMKNHIAETAQRMFQEEGFATVSMRRLAREAGCSPMTLYQYFDGKIAILQTLWAVVFEDLFDQLEARLQEETEPKERLRIASRHYVGYWLDHPEHYRMVFMAEGVTQPEVSMFIGNPGIAAGFGMLAQIISEASGEQPDDAAAKVKTDLVMGALHGIAHNKITISGYPWSDADVMIDHLIESLV